MRQYLHAIWISFLCSLQSHTVHQVYGALHLFNVPILTINWTICSSSLSWYLIHQPIVKPSTCYLWLCFASGLLHSVQFAGIYQHTDKKDHTQVDQQTERCVLSTIVNTRSHKGNLRMTRSGRRVRLSGGTDGLSFHTLSTRFSVMDLRLRSLESRLMLQSPCVSNGGNCR